jgi:hypothetical protein
MAAERRPGLIPTKSTNRPGRIWSGSLFAKRDFGVFFTRSLAIALLAGIAEGFIIGKFSVFEAL